MEQTVTCFEWRTRGAFAETKAARPEEFSESSYVLLSPNLPSDNPHACLIRTPNLLYKNPTPTL